MKRDSLRNDIETKLLEHLIFVYGEFRAQAVHDRIMEAISQFTQETLHIQDFDDPADISEKDVILITYGGFIKQEGQSPLQTLTVFLDKHLKDQISIVHILPFYPYSSDDGFSVIDYRLVNQDLGSWADIRGLSQNYRLMFDAVINHISRESDWFKAFIEGDDQYEDYFITGAESWDLSNVMRPRTSNLLTEVETANGPRKVWTTFSGDQIDLNYANPEVFLEIVELLLFYVRQGASVIRLDAIAYLWKESGTSCIHLPQTHRLIKILRLVFDLVAPHVILITETNVPHEENISYFGDIDEATGVGDEAHMVYQFPLAPLVLHTLISGRTNDINEWIEALEPTGVFMNFIASHDGIGMMPAIGLIDEKDVETMIAQVKAHGGLVSYKSNSDGSDAVYELNTTVYDALNNPNQPDPPMDIARFIASQVMMISLAGVPGIYFHSLLGSRNAHDYYQQTGRARSINRKGFHFDELETMLSDPKNIHSQVFEQFKRLLDIRTSESAFHPQGGQRVIRVSDRIFALERSSLDHVSKVLVLLNVTKDNCDISVDLSDTGLPEAHRFIDLIGNYEIAGHSERLEITLKPYQAMWLKAMD
jgi:sucrose phosphorylase